MAETNPIRGVLELAVELNASDVHIKTDSPVMLRVKGALSECDFTMTQPCMDNLIDCMLSKEQKIRFSEKGDIDISYAEPDVGRFRVNIHKQRGEPAIAMRYVKSKIADFETLGLPSQISRLAELERGIVFITGTTGSGKSTTLASIINHINKRTKKHIITIEDPIEYEFNDQMCFIEQREVGLDTTSFDSAFMHCLRQDPDIIVVGEMRSRDSFDSALKAADTGHLVFSTLHTMNASQSINRIIDFYEASEHLAIRQALVNSLSAIVSQRLIPKVSGDNVIPAVEIMFNSPVIKGILAENKLEKLGPAIEASRNEGMQSFNQALVELVNNGIISVDDAIKNASNPETLKMNLKGIFLGNENQILS